MCPAFDRKDVKEGIVHIGVGGFHRAHLAVYIDSLMGQHNVHNWAICGVGLQPGDAGMRDALTSQDCMYTVVE
ncbi:MAG: mannitol dehydrogenase family protein, partial [Deltaproteobacteria bacterium]